MRIRSKQKIAFIVYKWLNSILDKTDLVLFQGSGEKDLFGNISSIKKVLDHNHVPYRVLHKPLSLMDYVKLSFNIAKAKVLVIDSQSPSAYLNISEKTTLVNVWHASGAYKTLGFDTIKTISEIEKEKERINRIFKKTDFFICSSKEQASIYANALHMKKSIFKALGIPRTDAYIELQNKQTNTSTDVKKEYKLKPTKFLYAPTFRGRLKRFNISNLENLENIFKDRKDISLSYKGHPTTERIKNLNINDVSSISLNEAICNYDVLITDYSSILFDFLLLDKPFILYVPDLYEYEKEEFPLYFKPSYIAPNFVAHNEEELISLIEKVKDMGSCHVNDDLKKRMLSSCDGKSSKRVCDFLVSLMEQ